MAVECHLRRQCLLLAAAIVVDIIQVAVAHRARNDCCLPVQTFRCVADAASDGASTGRLANLRALAAGARVARTRQTRQLLCARLPAC